MPAELYCAPRLSSVRTPSPLLIFERIPNCGDPGISSTICRGASLEPRSGTALFVRPQTVRTRFHVSAPEIEHALCYRKPGPYLERSVSCCCNLFIISHMHGGGGGSRTPVRKALRHEAYMLSSIPFVSPAALRMSKKRSRLVRWFSPESYGPKDSGQLTV
jgi:hypothetical protein